MGFTQAVLASSSKSIGAVMRLLALISIFVAVGITSSHAEFNIQIGGSEAEFKARLAQEGYDRINTVKLGLSSSKFDACHGQKRYRIKFKWTGETSRKIIGNCRQSINQKSVRKILRDRGYRRIDIEDRAGKYIAVGCLNSKRYRIEMNYFGDIGRERRIGACEQNLSPADVSVKLKEAGFNRINFTDRRLPKYVAEACKNTRRVELTLNRRGEILESRRIGKCRSAIHVNEITSILQEKGYSRVTVIDDRLPRYMAQGCKNSNRLEISMNRWGDIRDEVVVGKCRRAYNQDEILASMRESGYKNISIHRDGNKYITRGCSDNRLEEIILSKFGELISRKELGSCKAPRINNLAETLRERGLTRLQFFVDACRGNKRVRLSFDEFANRTGREVIGGC